MGNKINNPVSSEYRNLDDQSFINDNKTVIENLCKSVNSFFPIQHSSERFCYIFFDDDDKFLFVLNKRSVKRFELGGLYYHQIPKDPFENPGLKFKKGCDPKFLKDFKLDDNFIITNPIFAVKSSYSGEFLEIIYPKYNEGFASIWMYMPEGQIELIRKAHKIKICALAISKNYIIAAFYDQRLKVWSKKAMKYYLIYSYLCSHDEITTCLKISNDEKLIFSGSSNGCISIWDLEYRELIHNFDSVHEEKINDIASLNENCFIIAASKDGTISLYDINKKTYLHTFESSYYKGPILCLRVTDDNRFIVAVCSNYILQIDLKTDQVLNNTFINRLDHEKSFDYWTPCTIDFNNNNIAILDQNGRPYIGQLSQNGLVPKLFNGFTSLKIIPNQIWIVLGHSNGKIYIWNLETNCQEEKEVSQKSISCIGSSNDGRYIIAGCLDGDLHIWTPRDGVTKVKPAHKDRITRVCVIDVDHFLTGSADRSVIIWKFEGTEQMKKIDKVHTKSIFSLAVSSDGNKFASASSDSKVKIWDCKDKKNPRESHSFQTYSQNKPIKNLAFLEKNDYVLSFSVDCVLEVFSLQYNQAIYLLLLECKSPGNAVLNSDQTKIIIFHDAIYQIINNPFKVKTVLPDVRFSQGSNLRFAPLQGFIRHKEDPKHTVSLIRSFPYLQTYPDGWNWLHISAMFAPNKKNISACIEENVPIVVDFSGKTVLHYIFFNKEVRSNTLESLILENFEKLLPRKARDLRVFDALSDIFIKILKVDSSSIINFLHVSTKVDKTITNEKGRKESKVFQARKNKRAFYLSESSVTTEKVKDELLDNIEKDHTASIKMIALPQDYSLASDFSKDFFEALVDSNSKAIFETEIVSNLVKYYWSRVGWMHYCLAVLHILRTIFIALYIIGIEDASAGYKGTLFTISGLMILYEILELRGTGFKRYFRSLWNIADILGPILTLILVAVTFNNKYLLSWKTAFAFLHVIMFGRLLLFLRCFKKFRRFVKMVVESFKRMPGFAVVIIFMMLAAVFILKITDESDSNKILTDYLQQVFELILGDPNFEHNSSGMVVIKITIMIIAVVTVLSLYGRNQEEVYDEIQQNLISVDSKVTAELVLEIVCVFRNFSNLRTSGSQLGLKTYLFIGEAEDLVRRSDD